MIRSIEESACALDCHFDLHCGQIGSVHVKSVHRKLKAELACSATDIKHSPWRDMAGDELRDKGSSPREKGVWMASHPSECFASLIPELDRIAHVSLLLKKRGLFQNWLTQLQIRSRQ
ncbi:hypothetical protein [Bradyrhizobium sp. ISRA430]|uniref:hypothetical protein n=1 Tax=Bradyrhizobium sp. ISRA430 TaxID=2866192 RepID=UPI00247A14CB|nr:hypothetical protein [Bradyrhizobium sp. ISRA430]WGR77855.1 hypothetical protein MTX21_34245 [Bradyrhizobium sp. ISRA430]